jgi:hypothetical protein
VSEPDRQRGKAPRWRRAPTQTNPLRGSRTPTSRRGLSSDHTSFFRLPPSLPVVSPLTWLAAPVRGAESLAGPGGPGVGDGVNPPGRPVSHADTSATAHR